MFEHPLGMPRMLDTTNQSEMFNLYFSYYIMFIFLYKFGMGIVTDSGPWVLGYGCETMGMGMGLEFGTWVQVPYVSLIAITGVFQ